MRSTATDAVVLLTLTLSVLAVVHALVYSYNLFMFKQAGSRVWNGAWVNFLPYDQ